MQLNPSWEDRPTISSNSQEILTFIEIGSFIMVLIRTCHHLTYSKLDQSNLHVPTQSPYDIL
jgi:hypothetical protein